MSRAERESLKKKKKKTRTSQSERHPQMWLKLSNNMWDCVRDRLGQLKPVRMYIRLVVGAPSHALTPSLSLKNCRFSFLFSNDEHNDDDSFIFFCFDANLWRTLSTRFASSSRRCSNFSFSLSLSLLLVVLLLLFKRPSHQSDLNKEKK